MYQEKERNERISNVRNKMMKNLAISWLIPVVLVIILRKYFASDTVALGIAGVIPVVRTIFVLVWQRKIDWIGIFGIIGFGMALAVSILSGGSSLPLKLYRPIITGIIGLVLLCSVVVRKPLMGIIIKRFAPDGRERFNRPGSLKKFTYITLFLGIIFVLDAAVHIIMALTLSTVEYLSMSRVVTIAGIAVLVLVRMYFTRIRNKI